MPLLSLNTRTLVPELMDDPSLDPAEHRRALKGLARINTLSGAGTSLWRNVRPLLARASSGTLLDVAAGSGDVTLAVAQAARRDGVSLDLRVVEISPEAASVIRSRASAASVGMTVDVRDAVAEGLGLTDESVDVAVCSLFLHHLTEDGVVSILREMKRVARRGVVVSDLRRCRTGLAAAYVAGRVLTRSPVVRVDAVLSVRAAFTVAELTTLAEQAGLSGVRILASWPFRLTLTWSRA
ncbi:MAG: methyltransferase domain-containing protein [Phycisphaerales bacterium]